MKLNIPYMDPTGIGHLNHFTLIQQVPALGAAPLEFSETKERYFEAQDENWAKKKGPLRCFGYIGDYILYNWVSMVYREYNYHLGCYTGIIINHYI